MRVLVLWRQRTLEMRNTILDNVFCFQRYDPDHEYFYFNIYNGRFAKDYAWIREEMFDAVIFHCTALALRDWDEYWRDYTALMHQIFGKMSCKKIILVQDDYTFTSRIWDFIKAVNINKIYTIMRPQDHTILYPKNKIDNIENIEIETILTGYVEESYISQLSLKRHSERALDLIYRANQLPYEFGRLGQLKYEIVKHFQEALTGSELLYDIANTRGEKNAILGDSWLHFLASSRTVAGSLGGAGMADYEGEYRFKFKEYMKQHPDAGYEEAKSDCFPDLEENLTGMISPRIFESAITKTCQILVGDDYQDILQPDIDYIMLNEDYSNINDVLEQIKDVDYCEKIADQCYQHVVESGKYSYMSYVQKIVHDLKKDLKMKEKSLELSRYIEQMCRRNNDSVLEEIRQRG